MIAIPCRQQIRELYDAGKTIKQIVNESRFDIWTVKWLVHRWDSTKRKQAASFAALKEKKKPGPKPAPPMPDMLGIERLRKPVRCDRCRVLVSIKSKRHEGNVCYHCHLIERKELGAIVV
jgi:hypothetical protein